MFKLELARAFGIDNLAVEIRHEEKEDTFLVRSFVVAKCSNEEIVVCGTKFAKEQLEEAAFFAKFVWVATHTDITAPLLRW